MRRAAAAVVALVSGGCNGHLGALTSSNARVVENQDAAAEARLDVAWRGQPVLAMEKHAVFSSMNIRRQDVSDGSVVFHHFRCADWHESGRAFSQQIGGAVFTHFDPGASGSACCDRQFVTRNGVIEAYRQVPSKDATCTAEEVFYPDGKRPTALAGHQP